MDKKGKSEKLQFSSSPEETLSTNDLCLMRT